MRPYKYDIIDGITHFRYKLSELREFLTWGKRHGNKGVILVSRRGAYTTYKGFGTIENPCTRLTSLSLNHFEPYDGKMSTDDEIINYVYKPCPYTSHRFVILNFNK